MDPQTDLVSEEAITNLNNITRVKLTEKGVQALADYHKDVPSEYAKRATPGTMFTAPLWQIMEIFGPHISMGIDPPFEMSFEIDTKDRSARIAREKELQAENEKLRKALSMVIAHTGRMPYSHSGLLNGLLDSCERVARTALSAAPAPAKEEGRESAITELVTIVRTLQTALRQTKYDEALNLLETFELSRLSAPADVGKEQT